MQGGPLLQIAGRAVQITVDRASVDMASVDWASVDFASVDRQVCVGAGRTFTPLEAPPAAAAGLQASARTELVMQTRGSRFVKFQEVRIQELAAEVGSTLNACCCNFVFS